MTPLRTSVTLQSIKARAYAKRLNSTVIIRQGAKGEELARKPIRNVTKLT